MGRVETLKEHLTFTLLILIMLPQSSMYCLRSFSCKQDTASIGGNTTSAGVCKNKVSGSIVSFIQPSQYKPAAARHRTATNQCDVKQMLNTLSQINGHMFAQSYPLAVDLPSAQLARINIVRAVVTEQ